jgi:rhodanese-related sulfurtransferase
LDEQPQPIAGDVETVAPADAYERVRQRQARLIDVRTATEFGRVHVRGARNIPLDKLLPAMLAQESTPVYLICRGGTRSREAYDRIRAVSPTTTVAVVDGGMLAWSEAGLPLVRNRPGRFWRLGRNAALAAVGISILLAIFVNKGLIGIAGLVGAVVVAVMMFDRRRWRLAVDDEATAG